MKAARLVTNGLYLRDLIRNGRDKLLRISFRTAKETSKDVDNFSKSKQEDDVKLTVPKEKEKFLIYDLKRASARSDSENESDLHAQFIDWMKDEGKDKKKASETQELPSKTGDLNLPRLSRNSVEMKCRQLLRNLGEARTPINQKVRLKELCKHLIHYPEACGFTLKEGGLPELLRLVKKSRDERVQAYAREALALLGYCPAPNGRGIRILSIDGGGTKGIVVIEILRELEKITGQPIHKLFDLICGVSTGSILAMLLGAFKSNIDDCLTLYKRTSEQMFQKDMLRGTSRLLWTHAYYDTSVWEKILRGVYSERSLIETTQESDTPKIAAVSALMNTATIQPFVFRNYNHSDKSMSYFEGSAKYKIWQAIRASAAAPGYFEEFVLDNYVHQDGGVLVNNPTPVAIHEAQLLWPNHDIQVCISIGCGRYSPINLKAEEKAALTSLRNKITRYIDSATDTEGPHRLLQDLLKPGTYFRFNPTLSDYMALDENRADKLEQMQTDAQMYLRKNEYKLKQTARALLTKRSFPRKVADEIRLRAKMYSFS
ncbi:calcium-independent phospholipase A2-gamma-like [Brevipalpus obovatus]|uniref:calcium-independent phospholipase A2-gamma-like n=1 Tax=Brevipalpus obovatus TaxID=246614 RepID=UPI003D9F4116